MTPRRLVLPMLLLALTACGGGDDAKAEYVADASAVCTKAEDAFNGLTQPKAPADFAPFVRDTVAIAKTAQAELSALTPPAGDREDLQAKVLDPFAALVRDGEAFGAKVEAANGDQAALLPLLSQRPTSAGIDLDYLRSYGLGTCAKAIEKAG